MAGATLALIIGVANQFFLAAFASISVMSGQAVTQTQLSTAMRTVLSDVREAYERQNGPCVTFAGIFGDSFLTADNDTLCLRLPVIGANGTPDPLLYDLVVLHLNPATGELRRILSDVTGLSPRENSDHVVARYLQAPAGGVVFSSSSSNLIKCSLRTNRMERGWTHATDLAFQARLRNAP